MTNPLVSILTPCFNAAKTLSLTANSVFAQTYTDWEWIIVDDGSADNTPEILRQLSAQDSRLRIVLNAKNVGVSQTRQQALSLAQGHMVAFLDADDLWLPEKLTRQIAFMLGINAALSFTAYRRISEDGSKTGHVIRVPDRLTYEDLLKNTAMANSAVIVDRVVCGDFAIVDVPYEDYATWLSLLRRGHIAHGLRDDLMRYRVRQHSDSSNKWKSIAKVWNIYRRCENLSVFLSPYYTVHFAARALIKRMRF